MPTLLLLLAGSACSREPEREAPAEPAPTPVERAAPAPTPPLSTAERREDRPTVVFLGDSLTAGLGLGEEEAYPALVGEMLAERGLPIRVVNAGVSGDTSAGGLARLDWLLSQRPAVVFVALGANDGLRGQPVAAIAANLEAIVERSRTAGARVVLAGMKMPPNYGPEYTRDFEALYGALAQRERLPFLPFLLEGVAADPALNQPDGIHPTAEGQRRIAAAVAARLEPVLHSLALPAVAAGR